MIKKILFIVIILLISSNTILADNKANIEGIVYGGTQIKLEGDNYLKEIEGEYKFSLRSIPAGNYSISFEHIDFKPVVYNIKLNKGENLDLGVIEPIPKPGVIQGKITSNNKAVDNTIIKLLNKDITVKTDKKGYFRINNLVHTYDKEPYKLEVYKKGYEPLIIEKDVGINRLTFADYELDLINYIVKGEAIPDSVIDIDNKKMIVSKDKQFTFNWNITNDSNLNIYHEGYEDVSININPKESKEIYLDNIKQNLITYKTTPFVEDSWIGAYFFKNNLEDKYYPYLNIRLSNKNKTKADDYVKTILADYILIQDLDIIKEILELNITKVDELRTFLFNKVNKNNINTFRELSLISHLRKEVNKSQEKLNNLLNEYNYRFYHINLIQEEIEAGISDEDIATNNLLKNNISSYSTQFPVIENELEESKEATKILNDMIPMEYNDLINYENSPLISLYEKYNLSGSNNLITIKKVEPNIITLNRFTIEQIVNLFNLFSDSLIEDLSIESNFKLDKLNLENWYRWKEIS